MSKNKKDNLFNMNKDTTFEMAIFLLAVAADKIEKRRKHEQMCGYPEDYGEDELLLKRMKALLLHPMAIDALSNFMEKIEK